ncbi:hypothetical protein EYS09_21300 [Streptomyces kasugaensis]|uniref:CoA transferase n=1 Tax=Streptomyces kasugaensis TaxID=1946 RepID=A0A4Q9HRV9_STRKA|nr:CoA transferase [Streptomyces kasugaensis]TBO57707.1 hypothetical protein EYS09_21300 [Streptomyces kasugaensis]
MARRRSVPYRDRSSPDRIANAFAGLTYVTGEPDWPPVRSGYSTIDYTAAYSGAFSVVTALCHRDTVGGGGQVIDLALYEAGFRALEYALTAYATIGKVRERLGNRNPQIVPADDFTTSDGRRAPIHAGTDALFRRLCTLMGTPELADAPSTAPGPPEPSTPTPCTRRLPTEPPRTPRTIRPSCSATSADGGPRSPSPPSTARSPRCAHSCRRRGS